MVEALGDFLLGFHDGLLSLAGKRRGSLKGDMYIYIYTDVDVEVDVDIDTQGSNVVPFWL